MERSGNFKKTFFSDVFEMIGPIIFGELINEACLLSMGNCLHYDNAGLATFIVTVLLVSQALATLFRLLALVTSKVCKVPPEDGQTVDSFVGQD